MTKVSATFIARTVLIQHYNLSDCMDSLIRTFVERAAGRQEVAMQLKYLDRLETQ